MLLEIGYYGSQALVLIPKENYKSAIANGPLSNKIIQTVETSWKQLTHFLLLREGNEPYPCGGMKQCKRAWIFDLSGFIGAPVARLVTKAAKHFSSIHRYLQFSGELPKCILRSNIALERLQEVEGVIKQYGCLQTCHKDQTSKFVVFQSWCNGGDLFDRIKYKTLPSDLSDLDRIACNLLRILAEIHVLGVYHRDLKTENILFDKNGEPVITDFDMAYTAERNGCFGTGQEDLKAFCGSIRYLAPEILAAHWKRFEGDSSDFEKMTETDLAGNDVWAMGLILYCLYYNTFPTPMLEALEIENEDPVKTLRMLKDIKEELPPDMNHPMIQLISEMLCRDPKRRITSEAAYQKALQFSQL